MYDDINYEATPTFFCDIYVYGVLVSDRCIDNTAVLQTTKYMQ
jgi:hypothetical protein